MKSPLLTIRTQAGPLAIVAFAMCLPISVAAQATTAAAPTAPAAPAYKIINDGQIIIFLGPDSKGNINPALEAVLEDITPCLLQDPSKLKYNCTKEELDGTQPSYRLVKRVPGSSILSANNNYELSFPSGTFRIKRLYRLTYAQANPASPSSVSIDTSPTISLTYEPRSWTLTTSGVYLFQLTSPVAFLKDFPPPSGKHLTNARPANCTKMKGDDGWTSTKLSGSEGKGGATTSTINGWIGPLEPLLSTDLKDFRLGQMGVAYLCASLPSSNTEFTPDSTTAAAMLNDIESTLGMVDMQGKKVDWNLAPGSKISLPAPNPVPATAAQATTAKTDATFYANLNIAAGTGSKLSWGLDGKISKVNVPVWGGFLTLLSATANTGNNTSNIKGQTYTDTIDWTLPWWRQFGHGGSTPFTLRTTVAPVYETDIEFDRKNMLAAIDSMWTFKNLYRTQSMRTPGKNGARVKYPDKTLARLGYGLQFHGGFELGGALIDTIQKATSGKAEQTVPTYSIARAVPQIRGLLQWIPARSFGLLTLDDTIAGRFLFDTENTVEQFNIAATATQASTVGLHLRPINGWKAINTLTGTWYPPDNAHVGITTTYNNGFNAPKFTRVNSVTIGVTIIY
jgi:hypothetical protein